MNETNHPARRLRHGDRPTEPLVFEEAAANKAAEEGGLPADKNDWLHTANELDKGSAGGYIRKRAAEIIRQAIAADRASRQVANKAEVASVSTLDSLPDLMDEWVDAARGADALAVYAKIEALLDQHIAREVAAQAGQVAVPGWIDIDATEPPEHELIALRYWPYGNSENPQAVTGGRYIDGTYYNDEGDEMHPPSHWCRLPYFDAEATAQASTSGERQEGGKS